MEHDQYMRRGVGIVSILAVCGIVACSPGSKSTPQSSTCSVGITGRTSDGSVEGLTSCAGLAGMQPPPTVHLRVHQSWKLNVNAGGAGAEDFSTDAPAVLAVTSTNGSGPTFVARSPGHAEVYVRTRFCTVHNGTVDSCPLASVTVSP